MRILITGGLGFIGTKLRRALAATTDHEVFVFDRERIVQENYIRGDVNDYFSLERAFATARPDLVVHYAAMVSRKECEETPDLAIRTNTIGAQNVVHLCLNHDARLVYAGSSEEYGSAYMAPDGTPVTVAEDTPFGIPTSYYGMTKRHADELIRYNAVQNGLVASTTRFCMLYGPGELGNTYRSAVARFIDSAKANRPITAHVNTERSWCFIDDAVEGVLRVLHRDQTDPYEVYNIGNDEPISAVDLAKKVVGVFASSSPILEAGVEPTIIPIKRMSFARAKAVLGWEARTSLEEGLRRMQRA